MNLFIFRCKARHDLYGATRFETGSDLPLDRCAGGWEFVRLVNLSETGNPRLGVDVSDLRNGIRLHGWHVWESSAQAQRDAARLTPPPGEVPLAPPPTAAADQAFDPPPVPVVGPPSAPAPPRFVATSRAVSPRAAPRPSATPTAARSTSTRTPPPPAEEVAVASSPGAMQPAGHRVVWFDIPVRDLDRAMRFYSTVLGVPLTRQQAGPAAAICVLPHAEGTIGGCLVQSMDMEPGRSGPLLYLNAQGRLEAAVIAAQAAGGTVLQPKHSVGPYGFRAIVLDSEGNRIALHSM